jgi:hypothetical protein
MMQAHMAQLSSVQLAVFFHRRAAPLALLAVALTGCAAAPALAQEPLASREFQVAPGTAANQVLACAEKTVMSLSKTQNNWDNRITLKDAVNGRFETGNFPEKNVMGFRVSLRFAPKASMAQVQLKGAGPYFVDLGVDGAIESFVQQTTACLASS